MSSEDSRPLSELPLEELTARLQALRARRAQPRGVAGVKTPGVIGPGETTARRAGPKKKVLNLDDLDFIADSLGIGEEATDGSH